MIRCPARLKLPGQLCKLRHSLLVLQELIRRDHRDAIPWADLMAQRAADAAGEVDGADLERLLVAMAGDGADAIDGADDQARLAAGAHVLVEEGQDLGEFLLCHPSVKYIVRMMVRKL